jgi:hypothetical protein
MSDEKKLTYADLRGLTVEQKLKAVEHLSDEEFDKLLAERDSAEAAKEQQNQ